MEPTHRTIIEYLDKNKQIGPFSINEVVRATQLSVSSVTRCLLALIKLKLVEHKPGGYGYRNYRLTVAWRGADAAINDYEDARALGERRVH